MGKYNAALRQSSMVNFDENLSFLNTFTQASVNQGGPVYDKNKSLKYSMGGAGFGNLGEDNENNTNSNNPN